MSEYEYKVVAAPVKGIKTKGAKSAEDRFSNALQLKMNEMAAQGWEYQRAETLPSTERSGLTSTKTVWHNVLVFRRVKIAPPKDIPVIAPPLREESAADGSRSFRRDPPLIGVASEGEPPLMETDPDPAVTGGEPQAAGADMHAGRKTEGTPKSGDIS